MTNEPIERTVTAPDGGPIFRVPVPVPLGRDGFPDPSLCACLAGIAAHYDDEAHYPGDLGAGCSYAD